MMFFGSDTHHDVQSRLLDSVAVTDLLAISKVNRDDSFNILLLIEG
jgi:hypothetical protein